MPFSISASHPTGSPAFAAGDWRWPAGHVLFWGFVLGFFVFFFGREAQSYGQSFLFVTLLLPVAMGTTYVLTHVLVPRYLLRGEYGRFALYGLYTLVVSVYLELLVLVGSFIFLAGYEMDAMNPATLDVFGLVVALYVVVFLAMAINLTARWHHLRGAHAEAERERLEAELELRKAELDRLETQMQPHFLFNTLNNLYGLTLEGSEDAPDVVLHLADLLDYVLDRSDRALVPVSEEVDHLETYLELERLRFGDRVDVEFAREEIPTEAYVAPMLFVPLVENAFKHGVRRSASGGWVRIGIRVRTDGLCFTVANSLPDDPSARPDDERSGIGLDNVRRRLELLYSEAAALHLDRTGESFTVRLEVPLRASEERPFDGTDASAVSPLGPSAPR